MRYNRSVTKISEKKKQKRKSHLGFSRSKNKNIQIKKSNILSNLSDNEIHSRVQKAVSLDLEKKKALNAPIAIFDPHTKKVRLSDGTGQILSEHSVLRKGKYSERVKKKA